MESWINTHLGNKLKALREKSDKKQIEMAFTFNMKQQSYCKIEKGKTNFSDKIVNKICDVFYITPLEFLTISLPKTDAFVKPSINNIDDFTTRILFASFRKQIAEQKLRIAELEIAARRQKVDKVITENIKPIYVMI
jgi:DNA-binding XRE family transcriptional regulator